MLPDSGSLNCAQPQHSGINDRIHFKDLSGQSDKCCTNSSGREEEEEGGRVKHDSQHSQSDLKHSKNFWNKSKTDVREG